MSKLNLIGLPKSELETRLQDLGEKQFRGRQLFKWLYSVRQYDFELMTDLSKELRDKLADSFEISGLKAEDHRISVDGTEKFLFRLDDGKPIETVVIPSEEEDRRPSAGSGRKTACISSQSGCAVGCFFCATGTMGLLRDLTAGEIVGQLMFLRDKYGPSAFSNVVMMGMGEPLLNFKNVIEAIRIMTDEIGLNISPKKIVLSTSGITPKIMKLAEEKVGVRLALSLHAATQQKRQVIMPIAKTFKLDNLMKAVRQYADSSKLPVTFEYILFDGFNDTKQDIEDLSRLVRGLRCKINVIAYNPVPGLDFKRPSDDKINWFGKELNQKVKAVTVRKSRGRDIEAACGQLAARKFEKDRVSAQI
ncbi:MAG: 23S rRNA (adenine(2503)-C(2))-methyltransferase RlmN [candidate division Zixibacteria bacterium]|nr:23S rRNA (adenine(2503)-C(2))-methyltransferase RlmN [candidate division Zixibacteria bacterium]